MSDWWIDETRPLQGDTEFTVRKPATITNCPNGDIHAWEYFENPHFEPTVVCRKCITRFPVRVLDSETIEEVEFSPSVNIEDKYQYQYIKE